MKQIFSLIAVLFLAYFAGNAQEKLVLPTQKQVEWSDTELGVIIHYDLITYEPSYVWNRDWGYSPDPKIFNPSSLDTDQWIQAAKAAGAKYAVLVAKHCVGFSLWPTEAHDYSVASTPWKNGEGDLIKDFIASCKKYGLKAGFYYSTGANGYMDIQHGKARSKDPVAQKKYNETVEKQLTELWSNYGDLFEIWFDGGVLSPQNGGPTIIPILDKLQPDAVVFQGPSDFPNLVRWVGNENGVAPYPSWSTANFKAKPSGVIDVDDYAGNPDGKYW